MSCYGRTIRRFSSRQRITAATGIYITTVTDDKPKLLHARHHNTRLSWSIKAKILVFTQRTLDRPNEVLMVREEDAVLVNLSQANDQAPGRTRSAPPRKRRGSRSKAA